MTELSQTILERWQVRKTKAQKAAFAEFLCSRIPGLRVEEGGFPKSRNLVLGDVSSARLILTAHYDTCARLPFPNFITPKNIPVFLAYNLLIALPFLLVLFGVWALLLWLTDFFFLSFLAAWAAMMGSMFYVMMGGPANPHTANDNTSGVITLCEIWAALPEERRKDVCFVFFDHEENGLLGSSHFARLHKNEGLKDTPVLNFDCVSDGDHILLVLSRAARRRCEEALAAAFPSTPEKTVVRERASRALYPSDQANFPVSIAAAALKKNRLVGLYMDRIHTKRDTVFDEANIAFLTAGTLRLLERL